VHLDLTARFALVPAAPRSEQLDRLQELRSFAPQELPAGRVHAHALDESHAPLVDYDHLLTLTLALVERRLELSGSGLEGRSDAVVEPQKERDEPIELIEILEAGRLLAASDLRQPGERRERIRPDDDRGQKTLELYDVEDPLAAAHEPLRESLEVFIRERHEGRHGQRHAISSLAATA